MYNRNEVHKIAILDLRLLNIDRNTQNILVQKVPRKIKKNGTIQKVNVLKLIPIDHGLCIPDNLEVCNFDLCWLDWRQASQPFSDKTMKYIQKINPIKDIRKIEKIFKFRPICLRNMRISCTLLKRGAEQGLNLKQIGDILCR